MPPAYPTQAYPRRGDGGVVADEDDEDLVVDDDDDSDDSDSEEETRILTQHRQARAAGHTHSAAATVAASSSKAPATESNAVSLVPTPPSKPAPAASLPPIPASTSSTQVAEAELADGSSEDLAKRSAQATADSARTPNSAAVTLLQQALAKIDAQRKLIAALVDDKAAADSAAVEAAGKVSSLQAEVRELQQERKQTEQLAKQAEAVLGLTATLSSSLSGPGNRPRSALERVQAMREALRPVCQFEIARDKAPSFMKGSASAEKAAADAGLDEWDPEERKELMAQNDHLESALARSQENCLQLQDLVSKKDKELRDTGAASGSGDNGGSSSASGARELARELARVQEVLTESTATWDAKQQELQRLRTLMRFSVLKRESEQLHTTQERCDQLEVTVSQERRKTREKQYEVERLERQLERALNDARTRKASNAELKRLRHLEAHCRAIIEAQDQDPLYNSVLANRQAADRAAAGRPMSAKSPRGPQAKALRQLLPQTVLRGLSADGGMFATAVPAADAIVPPSADRSPAKETTAKAAPSARADEPATASSGVPAPPAPSSQSSSGATKQKPREATTGAPAPPVKSKPKEEIDRAEQAAAAAPSRKSNANVSLPTDDAGTTTAASSSPAAGAAATSSSPSATKGGSADAKADDAKDSKPTPMSPAEDDGTAPITQETPFSVIAARMAKYLSKREDERKQKREEAEAAARAEMAKREQQRVSRSSRPYSAGFAVGGSSQRRTASYSSSAATGGSALRLPSEKVYDSVLKRQYQDLKARVDATAFGGSSTSRSPRGAAAGGYGHSSIAAARSSSSGLNRPTSAPNGRQDAARRPLSAHKRR